MSSIFRKKIEPSCSYCKHGINIGQGEVACRNRGIVSAHTSCNTFIYEPTKREPEFARSLNLRTLNEEDFKLTTD